MAKVKFQETDLLIASRKNRGSAFVTAIVWSFFPDANGRCKLYRTAPTPSEYSTVSFFIVSTISRQLELKSFARD
jgi:hypothetical protein